LFFLSGLSPWPHGYFKIALRVARVRFKPRMTGYV
jgi:hypothetical protein